MGNPQKTRIYRLTHYKNLPFIFRNGIYCANGSVKYPSFVNIGFQSLINSRGTTPVKVSPGGVLNDYVPFYFCPRSPMLYMIHKGKVDEYLGTQQELVYLASSVELIEGANLPYVFTDRHAKLEYAQHFNKYSQLKELDWQAIKTENWGQQYGETIKEKKQAEFLVHQMLPINLVQGIICHNASVHQDINTMMSVAGVTLPLVCEPKFYY